MKPLNNQILDDYRAFGFSSRTKMLDFALDLLRQQLTKKKRRSAREKMLNAYVQNSTDDIFENISGDDFE